MARAYYVDSFAGWFVVQTDTKRHAHSQGVSDFGAGMVKTVRPATRDEIEYYCRQQGLATRDFTILHTRRKKHHG